MEYFPLGKRDFIAVSLERRYNIAEEDEPATSILLYEVVNLDAAKNADRVKDVTTLQSFIHSPPRACFSKSIQKLVAICS